MTAYYNEIDPYAAQWLRNLINAGHIAPGVVDERSIEEVSADDLKGFTQCHFFAGIGGWSYAARLAGWSDDQPMWTGSCPCQPFSTAGTRKGVDDERHLWPVFFNLIRQCSPSIVFGEQVGKKPGLEWLDGVRFDLQMASYAFGAASLCASIAGYPERPRLFWVADADGSRECGSALYAETPRLPKAPERSVKDWCYSKGLVSGGNGFPQRVGRLRAYGNAIVPQVAAEFIKATQGELE